MKFADIIKRALEIRQKYAELETKKYGAEWNNAQLMEGFTVDVSDLMKIIQSKEGRREMENIDEKLAHELSDCLWSIIVLSERYNIDLEKAFIQNMDKLEKRIDNEL